MANTFTLIASYTVSGAGITQIQFASIPSTYTDLCLETSLRSAEAATQTSHYLYFNGVTTNRTSRWLAGSGSAASSSSSSDGYIGVCPAANATASTFGNNFIYITNYTSSSNKSVSVDLTMENNATTSYSFLDANLWSSSSAITSIELNIGGNQFATNSTAYLYGVKNS